MYKDEKMPRSFPCDESRQSHAKHSRNHVDNNNMYVNNSIASPEDTRNRNITKSKNHRKNDNETGNDIEDAKYNVSLDTWPVLRPQRHHCHHNHNQKDMLQQLLRRHKYDITAHATIAAIATPTTTPKSHRYRRKSIGCLSFDVDSGTNYVPHLSGDVASTVASVRTRRQRRQHQRQRSLSTTTMDFSRTSPPLSLWRATVALLSMLMLSVVMQAVGAHGVRIYDELHIGGIFPIGGKGGWQGGQACMPAARLALEDVNNKKDLLPGFKLTLHSNDSEVS